MRRGAFAVSLAAALATAAASGCDGMRPVANPEVPNWVHRPSWSMTLVYQRSIAAASRAETEPYERGRPELDIRGRRVFVGSSDRGFYALRAEDGVVLWRFETLGAVQCEPLYDAREDVVYFGSNDGALYKVRARDGSLLWRFATNAEVARRPVLDDGILYAVNANDTVIALDPATGQRRWSQHRTPALGMEVAGYAGPLVWRGLVYAGFSDGTVLAFDARTGAERWQPVDLSAEAEQVLGEVPTYLDVDTTPLPGTVDEAPAIFVGSYEGGVYALDAVNGAQLWANHDARGVTELMMWSEPAHPSRDEGPDIEARDLLIASTGVTGIWAIDPANGTTVWERRLPDGGVSAPAPIAGALMFATTRHGVYLMSPLDGGVIDGIYTGGGFSMAPAAHGRRAFILSNAGRLLSLHVTPPG
jgi:outer membrane protein assembly factor BamB